MSEKNTIQKQATPSLSDVLHDVKDSGVANESDGKINLTINGKTMEGLSPEGADEDELLENKIDYSKYDTLTDFFVSGLIDFSTFISRDIPDKFKKETCQKQELFSSRQGIKAYKVCTELLETQVKTGKSGYVKPEEFTQLHQWYTNGIIDFMGITMSDVPDELSKENDQAYVLQSGIDAFKQVRKLLLADVKEMMNVK